jgi:MOSC domain-containing protein YiiM
LERSQKVGKLLGIAIKEASRAPMKVLKEVTVSLASGIENDFRGRPGDRQVTVLSRESWDEACEELSAQLDWTTRRVNLLIEGVSLVNTTGHYLQIGDVILEISGEAKPCARMDDAMKGLKDALVPFWRAGATCRVIKEGKICIGKEVIIKKELS